MAQKLHLLLAEDGLLKVDGEAVLLQAAKDLTKMLSMRHVVRARNKEVVKVDKDERHSREDTVHQRPKGVMMTVFEMSSRNIST